MQKPVKFSAIATLILLLAVSLGAFAQAPNTIMYQGRLTNAKTGEPLVGTVTGVTFTIYGLPDTAQINPVYYTVTKKSIECDDNGVFTVELGPITNEGAFSGSERYLGITVGSDDEMTPYQELTSTLYSLNTANIPDNSVTTEKIATGAVSNTDLANNAVNSSKIQDGSVLFTDIGQNSASTGQIMKWNGTAWVASSDNTATTVSPGVEWVEPEAGATISTSSTTSGLTSISMKVPSAGYVIVTASGSIYWAITTTDYGMLRLKVSDTNNDVDETAGIQFIRTAFPSLVTNPNLPFSVSMVFPVASAGTYNFYFNAWHQVVNGTASMNNYTLIGMFVPNRY
jgi:hypothetical protein